MPILTSLGALKLFQSGKPGTPVDYYIDALDTIEPPPGQFRAWNGTYNSASDLVYALADDNGILIVDDTINNLANVFRVSQFDDISGPLPSPSVRLEYTEVVTLGGIENKAITGSVVSGTGPGAKNYQWVSAITPANSPASNQYNCVYFDSSVGAINDIKMDGVGNKYVLVGDSTNKFYVVKMDDLNSVVWQKCYDGFFPAPTTVSFSSRHLVIDGTGNIYVLQEVDQTVPTTSYTMMLVKLDSSGNIVWQKSFTPTTAPSEPNITLSATDVYVVHRKSTTSFGMYKVNAGTGSVTVSREITGVWPFYNVACFDLNDPSSTVRISFLDINTATNYYVTLDSNLNTVTVRRLTSAVTYYFYFTNLVPDYNANSMHLIGRQSPGPAQPCVVMKLPYDNTIPGTGTYSGWIYPDVIYQTGTVTNSSFSSSTSNLSGAVIVDPITFNSGVITLTSDLSYGTLSGINI